MKKENILIFQHFFERLSNYRDRDIYDYIMSKEPIFRKQQPNQPRI